MEGKAEQSVVAALCVNVRVCYRAGDNAKKREKYIHRLRQFEIFFFLEKQWQKPSIESTALLKLRQREGEISLGRMCECVNE